MMIAIIRAILVLALPFFLIWAFFSELFLCFYRAFQYAWLAVRSEFASFLWIWKDVPNRLKKRVDA